MAFNNFSGSVRAQQGEVKRKPVEFYILTLTDTMKSLGVHSESEVFDICRNKDKQRKHVEIYFHSLALILRGNKFPKVNL